MKRLSLILLSLCVGFSAFADEGMWLPSLISSRIDDMRSKGFRLTAEDVYSVNRASMKDAVVLFGRGCTGEIVSKQGLLLTNHHCGHSSIQRLSSVEHDYLLDGFWALSREQELPCEGLTVSILERMEDVTDRISAGESAESIVKEAEASGKGLGASVERMYYGNQYFLFVYKVFRDVRLVGAPPSALGSFGGNTDNWIWPRHTCDFSVFRIYAGPDNEPAAYSPENRPYVPRRSFPISTRGIREGDFTMIYGFPGNTQQYIISDAVDYVQHRSDPMKIALRTQRLDIMGEAQKASAEVRIKYANKYVSVANAWKKWQGEVLGLERLGTVDSRRRYEAEFEQWAADRPEYAGLLDSMRAAYAAVTEPYFESELYRESVGAIEVLNFVDRLAAINASEKLTGEEKAAKIETLRRAFYKDYEPDVDRDLAIPAHGADPPLLQRPQQLDLGFVGEVPDLVQKERSAVGRLESPHFVTHGTGKRALDVPEELRSRQLARNGPAIDRHEGFSGAFAVLVDELCHVLLARPAGAVDQHRHVRRSHQPDVFVETP